jgi:D-cysteine desulfhydrase
MIDAPPRVELARLPTPLERLPRLSERLGIDLWIKRDDLTGLAWSGNKIRKLEFHFAEMQRIGADTIVTCGGIQSNHCRATAAAARAVGMQCALVLRGDKPDAAGVQGNLLLDHLLGARIRFVPPKTYREQRDEVVEDVLGTLRDEGRQPYFTTTGGSDAQGAWGYLAAVEELAQQMAAVGMGDATVVHAVGSGGTTAGLALGRRLLGLDGLRIVGFNVCDTAEEFRAEVPRIANACAERFGLGVEVTPHDMEIVDGYVGRGYALSRPEEIHLIADVARTEGVVLDPVYTGKAFFGLAGSLEKARDRFGQRVIFLHTGGVFAHFAKRDDILDALGPPAEI